MPSARDVTLQLLVGAAAAVALTADHVSTPYDADFDRVGAAYGVPPDLLRALARWESGMRPSAVSQPNSNGTRDYGLMQVNEKTAEALKRDRARLLEPVYSIETAAMLLRALKAELGQLWSVPHWVAAYNAGAPAIKRRGIFNQAYVAGVWWHFTLYQLGALVRRSEA